MIAAALRQQGFQLSDGRVLPPQDHDKVRIRSLHEVATAHRRERARPGLARKEGTLLERVASGDDVDPGKIHPVLVEVQSDSEDELLFRYASLHWSIPVSSGYGRRLRFLVIDENNGKLMGLIGLGDPVYSLHARDEWIGWDVEAKKLRLKNVMDAFVLGSVPPYSRLLVGKLVAMLVSSAEVRAAVQRKYGGSAAVISGTPHDGTLALVTTTSALGRSSIYNRVKFGSRTVFQRVGFTKGSGDFHFSNGTYQAIAGFARTNLTATAKQERWGAGFRNKREVVRKSLIALGLSTDLAYHGVRREVFVIPLAANVREFLQTQEAILQPYDVTAEELFRHFRARWLTGRAQRDQSYREWHRADWRLWPQSESL